MNGVINEIEKKGKNYKTFNNVPLNLFEINISGLHSEKCSDLDDDFSYQIVVYLKSGQILVLKEYTKQSAEEEIDKILSLEKEWDEHINLEKQILLEDFNYY